MFMRGLSVVNDLVEFYNRKMRSNITKNKYFAEKIQFLAQNSSYFLQKKIYQKNSSNFYWIFSKKIKFLPQKFKFFWRFFEHISTIHTFFKKIIRKIYIFGNNHICRKIHIFRKIKFFWRFFYWNPIFVVKTFFKKMQKKYVI